MEKVSGGTSGTVMLKCIWDEFCYNWSTKLVENAETADRHTHLKNDGYNKMASDFHTNVSKIKPMRKSNKVKDV